MEVVLEVLIFVVVVYFCPSWAGKIKPILEARAAKRRQAKGRSPDVKRRQDDRLPLDETPLDPNTLNKEKKDE